MCRAGWRLQPLQKALIQKLGISWQQPAQSSLTASYGEVEPGIICESVIGNWPWRPAAAGAWPPCLKASCSQVPGVSPRESWCLGSFVMNTAGCWSSHQLMKPASQLQCRDGINVTHCIVTRIIFLHFISMQSQLFLWKVTFLYATKRHWTCGMGLKM